LINQQNLTEEGDGDNEEVEVQEEITEPESRERTMAGNPFRPKMLLAMTPQKSDDEPGKLMVEAVLPHPLLHPLLHPLIHPLSHPLMHPLLHPLLHLTYCFDCVAFARLARSSFIG
jgi:hypothetical protein